jgi:hypothetical protein
MIWWLIVIEFVCGFVPASNPRWPPAWEMNKSTLIMTENNTVDTEFLLNFGVVSIDWSYDKSRWVDQRPMMDEATMYTHAVELKKRKPDMRVFVYRNFAKALNWFESNRDALETNPSWFFRFVQKPFHQPVCTDSKCSQLYHDQLQTAQVPSPADPHPDGACNVTCDCGKLPCGEYVWDVAQTAVQDYMINAVLFNETALGSKVVDGLFIDDFWCSLTLNKTCDDPGVCVCVCVNLKMLLQVICAASTWSE